MRLQRNFEYRRRKNNQQYSNKGGRVATKRSTDDQSPTAQILSLQNQRNCTSGICIAYYFPVMVLLTFVLFTK